MGRPFYDRLPHVAVGALLILTAASFLSDFFLTPLIFSLLCALLVVLRYLFRTSPVAVFIDSALMVMLGLVLVSVRTVFIRTPPAFSGLRPESVEAVVMSLGSDPRSLGGGRWRAEGRLLSVQGGRLETTASGPVTVFVNGDTAPLDWGRMLTARGTLQKKNEDFLFYVESWRPGPWKNAILKWRHHIITHLSGSLAVLPRDVAIFLEALLLGRITDAGAPTLLRFREAGCMHLLALSGFHVGLLAVGLRRLFLPLAGRRIGTVLSLFAVAVYLFLAGPRASLIRAVFMYGCWAADNLLGRPSHLWGYLSLAFLVQILINPQAHADLSFRLSYLALAGILGPGRLLASRLASRLPRPLAGGLGISLGAQALTTPIVLTTFGLWRPAGLPAGLILTPLTALIMILGSLYMVFGSFGGTALLAVLGFAVTGTTRVIETVAAPFGRFPTVAEPWSPLAWLIAALGIMIPLILNDRRSRHIPRTTEPRFPGLDPRLSGLPESETQEKMGTKFPDQPGA